MGSAGPWRFFQNHLFAVSFPPSKLSMSLDKEMSSVVKGPLGFVGEFKQFISRGNVVDLAVGVIIGGAFGQITTSLVNDVVMPPISYLMSGVDVKSWAIIVRPAVMGPDPHPPATDPNHLIQVSPAVLVTYGNFLQTCLNFLIVAFVIFVAVKFINSLKRHEEAQPSAPPTPTPEEKLLTEIRDLLANR